MENPAVDQVFNLAIKGTEVAVRLAGTGIKNLAVLLAALLREDRRVRGRVRMTRFMKEGGGGAILQLSKEQYKQFAPLAAKYGALYTAINDNTSKSLTLLIRDADATKVNHIIKTLGWDGAALWNGTINMTPGETVPDADTVEITLTEKEEQYAELLKRRDYLDEVRGTIVMNDEKILNPKSTEDEIKDAEAAKSMSIQMLAEEGISPAHLQKEIAKLDEQLEVMEKEIEKAKENPTPGRDNPSLPDSEMNAKPMDERKNLKAKLDEAKKKLHPPAKEKSKGKAKTPNAPAKKPKKGREK